jgi:tetratricopeptide (TPR) repeat protein
MIKTIALLMVVMPILYFWHHVQVQSSAAALLTRADELESKKNMAAASESLYRYLKYKPEDVEAHIRLATTYDKLAVTRREKSRALSLYARAIGLAPSDVGLRRRHMELLLERGDFTSALASAEKLIAAQKDDAIALKVRALALYANWVIQAAGDLDDVVAAFQAAIPANQSDVILAAQLARILRVEVKPADISTADKVLDDLVQTNDRNAEAFLTRSLYRQEFGLPGTDEDLDHALALDPEKKHFQLMLAAAARGATKQDYPAAIEFSKRAIEVNPKDRRGYLALGSALAAQGKTEESLQTWQQALKESSPEDVEIELQIATAQIRLKRFDEAVRTLESIEKRIAKNAASNRSDHIVLVQLLRGEVAFAKQDYLTAVSSFNEVVRLLDSGAEPTLQFGGNARIYLQLGHSYRGLLQWDQAAIAYEKAADLDPRQAAARLAAAAAWNAAGRLDDAIIHFILSVD